MKVLENRGKTGRFAPGESGNPGGRPKAWVDFREAMRERSQEAVAEIDKALSSEEPEHRRWAAMTILAYAWGKPRQMTGGDEPEREEPERDAPPVDIVDLAKKVAWLLSQGAAEAARRGGEA